MLTNKSYSIPKSVYAKSIVAVFVVFCLMSALAAAQTKAPQTEAAPSAEQPKQSSVILSKAAAIHLREIFNFTEDPAVKMMARNEGAIEIVGLPYAGKVHKIIAEYAAGRPMASEEYLRCILPGPVLSGDRKMDVYNYETCLKLFFGQHPEARMLAPGEIASLLDNADGVGKVVDMQQAAGRYVEMGTVTPKAGPMEPAKLD